MRKLFGLFLAGALTLIVAGPAKAVLLPVSATFTIELGTFPPIDVSLTTSLNATTTPGSQVLGFTVPASAFTATLATPVSPAVALLPGVTLTSVSISASNATGSFTGNSGVMGLNGVANLLLHAFSGGNVVNLGLTGALGAPGTVTAKIFGLVPLTIKGNGYTTGVATAASTPLGGGDPTTLMRQGGVSTTLSSPTAPSGPSQVRVTNLTYVTPTQIIITSVSNIATFGTLSVSFTHATGHVSVPEPGTLLLLGSGLVGFGLIGRKLRK